MYLLHKQYIRKQSVSHGPKSVRNFYQYGLLKYTCLGTFPIFFFSDFLKNNILSTLKPFTTGMVISYICMKVDWNRICIHEKSKLDFFWSSHLPLARILHNVIWVTRENLKSLTLLKVEVESFHDFLHLLGVLCKRIKFTRILTNIFCHFEQHTVLGTTSWSLYPVCFWKYQRFV